MSPPYPTYRQLKARRTAARRREALRRATAVLDDLAERRVEARLTGSLATGRFRDGSDVDFLIYSLPDESLRYRLETAVEDRMGTIPFDLVYLDEVTDPDLRRRLLESARDRSDLARHPDRTAAA